MSTTIPSLRLLADETTGTDTLSGQGGIDPAGSLRSEVTGPLTAEQQRVVRRYEGLLRNSVKKVIDYYESRRFVATADDIEDLESEAWLHLCQSVRQIDPEQKTATAAFLKGKFDTFFFDQQKKIKKVISRNRSTRSLTRKDSTNEDVTYTENFDDCNSFLNDPDLPHRDLLLAIRDHDGDLTAAIPDRKNQKKWHRYQKPAVQRYLKTKYNKFNFLPEEDDERDESSAVFQRAA